MTLDYILKTIARKVQDSSYSDDDYINWINEVIGQIASEEALPDLVARDYILIRAGQHSDYRPSDYHSKLFHAYNHTKDSEVQVYKNLTEFLDKYENLDDPGNVEAVVVAGGEILAVLSPPNDQWIRIWYYKQPELLGSIYDSLPSYLPKELCAPLFINYCCMQAYSEIEDGIHATSPNFTRYHDLYEKARTSLKLYLGVPDGDPEFIEGDPVYGIITE